ncbi:hypothetical protein TNCT_154181 [Trichonephila clavata]|uniref:DUF19 domain-containing protein n=1 Tax=Trichonephila clavata TaxID=2740835 RepID=A0A8X6G865_TRICU|nr:hypothetical protein TNCT_154181 [Trichonephila clavata]
MWWFIFILFNNFILGMSSMEYNCAEDPLKVCNFEITKDLIPWNRAKFYLVCDKLVNYYECASENNFTQVDLCSWPLVLNRSEALVQDLCANQSVLRTRYLQSVGCFKRTIERKQEKCVRESEDIYRIYQATLENKHDRLDNLSEICIKDSYMKDCYMIAISRNCGYEESTTIGEILYRSESYYQSCRDRNEYMKAVTAIAYSNNARIKDIFIDYEDESAASKADSSEFKATA